MSTLRLSGLASGMDTESIVKELMSAQQLKVDNVERKKVGLELEKEVWQDFNTKVLSFYNNELLNSKLTSTFSKRKASTSSTLVEPSAKSTAPSGVHQFIIKDLAKGVNLMSSDLGGSGTDIKNTDTVFSAITSTPAADFDITINTKTITVTSSMTIQELVNEINSNVDGVRATYDDLNDRFFLSTTDTGSTSQIDISGTNADFFTSFGIAQGVTNGTDAIVNYQGADLTFSNNSVEINGITLDLVGSDPTETVYVTISDDTDTIYNNVKALVDKYNEVLSEANKLLYAEVNNDYEPLIDSEKEELDTDTITKWEDKVKASILRGDSILRRYTSVLRNTISSTTNYQGLSDIGIETGDYSEKGLLHIDEDALKDAISSDPEKVQSIINTIADELYEGTKDMLKSTTESSSLTLFNDKKIDNEIYDYELELAELEDWLIDIEDRYYQQFSAMELAIQQMNSQSASFASMFGYQ